jgi:hypothetical protein
MRIPSRTILVASILGACQAAQPPVPVSGEVMMLAGRWEGEYGSRESGRSGSILFTLAAGADTAHGDVIMVPNEWGLPPSPRTGDPDAPARRLGPAPQALAIAFVRAADRMIEGRLAPYRDPECGCLLTTMFRGRLTGPDTIEGTFVSLHGTSGPETKGWWRATRRPAASAESGDRLE